jgi:LPS export ABC transporter protein LptC
MIYRFIAALALIAAIVGVIWSGERERVVPATQVQSRDEGQGQQPGYAARHARLIQTGPDGHPLYTVEAESMRQQPADSTVELEQVHLGFVDDGGNLWKAWGDHGSLGQDTGQVDLVGNVHVAGLLPGTQNEAHLHTERLHVDTQAHLLHTTEPVIMTTADERATLAAHGLTADLRSGHVRLKSEVHGTYLP